MEDPAIEFLHQIGSRMAAADPLNEVLGKIVDFVVAVVRCDSCFVYVLEVQAPSIFAWLPKNPHPEIVGRLKIPVGQGITGCGGRASRAGGGVFKMLSRSAESVVQ